MFTSLYMIMCTGTAPYAIVHVLNKFFLTRIYVDFCLIPLGKCASWRRATNIQLPKKSNFEIFWECPLGVWEIWEYAFKNTTAITGSLPYAEVLMMMMIFMTSVCKLSILLLIMINFVSLVLCHSIILASVCQSTTLCTDLFVMPTKQCSVHGDDNLKDLEYGNFLSI